MESMRMFPLGSPLIPFSMVTLRIFEPRYLQMIGECVEQAAPFGVVLIERGFEVGGGDQRSVIGTVAQLVDVSDLPDGELAVVAVGVERIRVLEWLPDDPYPIAPVERLGEDRLADRRRPASIRSTTSFAWFWRWCRKRASTSALSNTSYPPNRR